MYLHIFLLTIIIHLCLTSKSYYVQLNNLDLNACNKDNSVFDILSFNIWSNQLEIPGSFECSLSFNLQQDYSLTYATYEIKIERKLGPIWITIPCIADFCSEQSFCLLMKNSCSSKKHCQNNCELKSGSHTLEHIRIPLSSKLLEHEMFTNVQYRFKIRVHDHKKTLIGCFNGYLTLRKIDGLL